MQASTIFAAVTVLLSQASEAASGGVSQPFTLEIASYCAGQNALDFVFGAILSGQEFAEPARIREAYTAQLLIAEGYDSNAFTLVGAGESIIAHMLHLYKDGGKGQPPLQVVLY